MLNVEKKRWRWIREIKVGDVLRAPSGLLRVVRDVDHGIRTHVVFTIKHCSWTRRCYTVYTCNDLVQMKYRPTGKRIELNRDIDAQIAKEFKKDGHTKPGLTCCDVEGIS